MEPRDQRDRYQNGDQDVSSASANGCARPDDLNRSNCTRGDKTLNSAQAVISSSNGDSTNSTNGEDSNGSSTNSTNGEDKGVRTSALIRREKARALYKQLSLRYDKQVAEHESVRRVGSVPTSFTKISRPNNGEVNKSRSSPRTMNCRESSDKKPAFIVSLTCLADDRIVVADYNNRKVKLFSSDFTLRASSGTSELFAVNATYESEFVVVHSSLVRFYRADADAIVRLKKSFRVQRGHGIAFDNHIFAVVCDVTRGCYIKLFTEEGREIGTIDIGKIFGSQVEICPKIEMNSKLCQLYLTIYNNSSAVCLDFDGNKLWHVQVDDLTGGISMINNCLFVACHKINTIEKITKDGRYEGVVLTAQHGLCWPFRFAHQAGLRQILAVEAKDRENVDTVHILPLG